MRYPDGGGVTAAERSLANLTKQLLARVTTRPRQMQCRPSLLNGFLAMTGLDLVTPSIEDR